MRRVVAQRWQRSSLLHSVLSAEAARLYVTIEVRHHGLKTNELAGRFQISLTAAYRDGGANQC